VALIEGAVNPHSAAIHNVRRYYQATHFAYTRFWAGKIDQSIHFGYYDEQATTHAAAMLRTNEKLAEWAGIHPGQCVIDAGCGIGGSSLWLANRGCEVIGLNVVPRHIALAEAAARQRHLTKRASFRLADYANSGLPSETCDIVWCLESVVHAANKADVIREAYRLLKPGGRLVLVEYVVQEEYLTSTKDFRVLLEGWSMPSLSEIDTYRDYCQTAGFADFAYVDWSEPVRQSIARMRRLASIALTATRPLAALHLWSADRVAHSAACIAFADTFAAGLWKYTAIRATKPHPTSLRGAGLPFDKSDGDAERDEAISSTQPLSRRLTAAESKTAAIGPARW
jgi:tocopherol O-methyltransferase